MTSIRDHLIYENSELGREVFLFLQNKGIIPKNTVAASIHIEINQPIKVECTYYPSPRVKNDQKR